MGGRGGGGDGIQLIGLFIPAYVDIDDSVPFL